MAQPAGQGVENPSRQRRARIGQRNHDPEGRVAGGEIAGAVDRVDDPVQAVARARQYGGIGGAGFLADDAGLRQDCAQSFGQAQFAFPVCDGDEIIRRLFCDLIGRQIAKARHDYVTGDLPHQRRDGFMQVKRHQLR